MTRTRYGLVVRCGILLSTLLALSTFGLALTPPSYGQTSGGAPPATTTQPQQAPNPDVPNWRTNMAHTPVPKEGCFASTYPSTGWQEVPCTSAPAVPYPPASRPGNLPARGPLPNTIGNGVDASVKVTTGHISESVGSFDSVTGVTSETGLAGANSFSLQLNSNFFSGSPTCNGAQTPSVCQAWQQFVFSNTECGTTCGFMQYWLISYNTTCPGGWTTYSGSNFTDCYKNSSAISVPKQLITNLANLSVTGEASAGGIDTFIMGVGGTVYTVTGQDSVVDLAAAWTESEFNIVGDSSGSEATFNAGSSITVRTTANNGTLTAPSCDGQGFTAETNNLFFVQASSTPAPGTMPAIVFTESSTTSNTTPCNAAVSVAGGYTLSVAKSGSGTGTVTSGDGNINCGASCSAAYTSGTQVTLTATPTAGSVFSGWSGGGCSGTGTCAVTMSAAQSVTATFTLGAYTLSLTESGSGTGQVTSSPAGINCSPTSNQCSASFGTGASVTLTASAASGSTFTGWSGSGCSGTGTCVVTMNAAQSVTATFTLIPSFMLSVVPAGTGSGTVTSSPSGINCGGTCNASYQTGTQVTLTAAAASGSTFAGWSGGGGCSGIAACTVTISAATSVTATFVQDSSTNIVLVAAVLPLSRSVQVGATATAFATIIDAGPGDASTCTIAPAIGIPASFVFQTTDPATNALTGTANTPANIPQGNAQTFVIALTPTASFAPTDVAFTFGCANANPAPSLTGINTLNLSASTSPVPDIVALAASGDPGYVDIPGTKGTGDFAVATVNLGSAAQITAAANTGMANLPVTLTLCQTNPTSGACLGNPSPNVTTTIAANATPTFAIFVAGSATVADSPGVNRVFVTFTDSNGILRGETSVAVRTH